MRIIGVLSRWRRADNGDLPREPPALEATERDYQPPAVPFWRRWWHDLRTRLGSSRHAAHSPAELMMASEMGRMREALHAREVELYRIKLELANYQSVMENQKLEIELLHSVHQRDRARVEADQAVYAHHIAVMTEGAKPRG